IAYHPTVVTVMLGMNDGRYRGFDKEIFEIYASGYENLLRILRETAPDLRFTLIQPSPYDDVTRKPTFNGGYNATLLRYAEFVRDLARREKLAIADLNTPVVNMLRKAHASDAGLAARIVPDRVHPGPAGHLIMAGALLESWGATPLVTEVEIDAAALQVRNARNTVAGELEGGEILRWTQRDRALPTFVNWSDPATALAVRSSSFLEALNRQTLRVTGLTGVSYDLRINGAGVATLTAAQLAAGVNLAELPTPMMKQAESVHALTLKRAGVHNTRWRQLQMVFEKDPPPRLAAILDNLDALDADVAARQRAAAQPSACFYELLPH
ncbi:MAG: GDSL family lipase, partial [Candidatus Solibacter usitatus]|nr:GDSL family lipase [Candidatus Solibacter usitatus]